MAYSRGLLEHYADTYLPEEPEGLRSLFHKLVIEQMVFVTGSGTRRSCVGGELENALREMPYEGEIYEDINARIFHILAERPDLQPDISDEEAA